MGVGMVSDVSPPESEVSCPFRIHLLKHKAIEPITAVGSYGPHEDGVDSMPPEKVPP